MFAGLPGAGIAGIFYLFSALLMPVLELTRALLRRRQGRSRWAVALRQAGVALSIIGGVWSAGWLLGWAFMSQGGDMRLDGPSSLTKPQLIAQSAVVLTLCTLAFVVAIVELFALIRLYRRRGLRDASEAACWPVRRGRHESRRARSRPAALDASADELI